MGYSPNGITSDAIKMDEKKKELLAIKKYLLENLDQKEFKGMTLEEVNRLLNSIDDFEFLP